jgi:hypothetical protein
MENVVEKKEEKIHLAIKALLVALFTLEPILDGFLFVYHSYWSFSDKLLTRIICLLSICVIFIICYKPKRYKFIENGKIYFAKLLELLIALSFLLFAFISYGIVTPVILTAYLTAALCFYLIEKVMTENYG